MIPLLEIVFILAIRLVWRFRKTKPEIEKKILCKFIGPEDFSAKKILLKLFHNVYVVFYLRTLATR